MSLRYPGGFLTVSYDPFKVPNAPTIGTATNTGATSASISFTAPSNTGGGTITGYVAVATDSSSGATFIATGASSPISITGLTTGNTYTIQVSATNAYGYGPYSAASNSVTPASMAPTSVEYLVVAGGGSGGAGNNAGGGGAGGYQTATGFAVSGGVTYTVTVGAGGASAGGAYVNQVGNNGSNSVFSSITSIGGGGGSAGGVSGSQYAAKSGGSGGGGSSYQSPSTGASGTSGQGYAGGDGIPTDGQYTAGGGGGAAGVGRRGDGYPQSLSEAGKGGPGQYSSLVNAYFAGGGAAGTNSSSFQPVGGQGGGGYGSWAGGVATNGTANTGGGGGGGGSSYYASAAGGSGYVAIRYPDSSPAAASVTGTYTYSVSGGYRYYQWTSSGSITW